MQQIEVDWDIHKMIEAERQGFDEAPYVALRRLLKLPNLEPRQVAKAHVDSGVPWTENGISVPHGSLARMHYLRGSQIYEGRFLDGRLVVGGQSFDTLSAAASALAVTKDALKTNLNGWNYWEAQFPGEKNWRRLKDMRRARQKS